MKFTSFTHVTQIMSTLKHEFAEQNALDTVNTPTVIINTLSPLV